jgi:hypothetical protein
MSINRLDGLGQRDLALEASRALEYVSDCCDSVLDEFYLRFPA